MHFYICHEKNTLKRKRKLLMCHCLEEHCWMKLKSQLSLYCTMYLIFPQSMFRNTVILPTVDCFKSASSGVQKTKLGAIILLSLGVVLLLPLTSCWRGGGGMKPLFPYTHPKEGSHVVNSKFLCRIIFSTQFLVVNPLIIQFLSVYSFKILCGFLACKNP